MNDRSEYQQGGAPLAGRAAVDASIKTFKVPRWLDGRVPLAVGCALLAGFAPAGAASPEPSDAEVLLNLFQEKGLITTQEADKARAELTKRSAQTVESPAGFAKPQFNKWVERADLYGDARLRFEHRSGEDGLTANSERLERNRWRYRVRAGMKLELADSLRAGVQLETGANGRSTNVTFGDDAGVWGKSSDGIFLGLLYLNWTPTDSLGVTAGRQANPFKVTSLVWDGDLAPEGLTETFKTKAGKFDLFATFGQYVYDDSNPDNAFGGGPSYGDAFLFVNQVGAKFNLTKDVSAQIAPVLHVYSGGGDSFRGTFVGTTVANTTPVNDLLVLEIPVDVRFKVGALPITLFGDFAVNLEGAQRARAAGTPQFDDEVFAWEAGVEIGSAKKKGDWSLRAYYQRSDLYALDANLVDSDLFDSRLNVEGFAVRGTYAFTDYLTFTLTYARADRHNRALPTGAVGDLGLPAGTAYLENYQQFQADLSFKF